MDHNPLSFFYFQYLHAIIILDAKIGKKVKFLNPQTSFKLKAFHHKNHLTSYDDQANATSYALTSAIPKNEVIATSKQKAWPFQSMAMFIDRETNIFQSHHKSEIRTFIKYLGSSTYRNLNAKSREGESSTILRFYVHDY